MRDPVAGALDLDWSSGSGAGGRALGGWCLPLFFKIAPNGVLGDRGGSLKVPGWALAGIGELSFVFRKIRRIILVSLVSLVPLVAVVPLALRGSY